MGYRIINGKLYSVGDFKQISSTNKVNNEVKSKISTNFNQVLKDHIKKQEGFILSNHAAERLRNRSINLNESDMKNINEAMNKAEKKGAKDCLILYKELALIASIKNRTIITAVDKNSCKNNVFTNIDSVVLI